MRDLSWMLVIATLAGCGPAVSLGDSSSGDASTGAADGDSTGAPPSSTTTGAPPAGSTGEPETCFVGQIRACTCPDGSPGERQCGPDRILGPCECGDATTSGGWGTSGSTGGSWPDIPDLPPGEVCLPPTLPCSGDFLAFDDESLVALSTCSRIQGSLLIEGNVTSLAPLACLVSVQGPLFIDQTELLDLGGLGIQSADFVAVTANSQLLSLDLPAISTTGALLVLQNPNLMDLQLGNLDFVEVLDFTDNPLLPDCVVAELIAQSDPQSVTCAGNLETGCADICG